MNKYAAALVISGVLAITSCTGGGKENSGSEGSTAALPALTVDVKNMRYTPEVLTVHVGDTVTWRFKDPARHDVSGISASATLVPPLQSSLMSSGEYRYTFTAAGTFPYTCTIHPNMTGKVIVEP